MPYKSKAQQAYLHINNPKLAKKWDKHHKKSGAPWKSLPYKVSKKKSKKKENDMMNAYHQDIYDKPQKPCQDPIANERLPGGLGAGYDPAQFDQKQLMMGINVEFEHTSDVATAMEIAMDHLAELPDYYTRLKSVEGESRNMEESKYGGKAPEGFQTKLAQKLAKRKDVRDPDALAAWIKNNLYDECKKGKLSKIFKMETPAEYDEEEGEKQPMKFGQSSMGAGR